MEQAIVKSVQQVTHKRQTSNKIINLIRVLKEMFFYIEERHLFLFGFLYDNDIETTEQLTLFKANAENEIEKLIMQRKQLYGKDDTQEKIAEINKELRELRKDVRMCDNIFADDERIR